MSSFERLAARHQCRGRPDQPSGSAVGEGVGGRQEEETFHISILTLAEYDKAIHNLADDGADGPATWRRGARSLNAWQARAVA